MESDFEKRQKAIKRILCDDIKNGKLFNIPKNHEILINRCGNLAIRITDGDSNDGIIRELNAWALAKDCVIETRSSLGEDWSWIEGHIDIEIII